MRRRKRIDTESSSLHGSGLSLFEPLQVDVSTPSTNTVILTPSKITIEHSSDYEGTHDKKPSANGRTMVKRTRYISSPVQWSYARHPDDVNARVDRTDFIEIVSEPDEFRSHSSKAPPANPSKGGAKRVNNGIETPKKPSQYDDSNAFSIWEMAKDNNEQTIIFHHKSDNGDKCCDNNYCPRTTESDTELEISADRSCTTKVNDEDSTGKLNCCTSMSSSLAHLDQLNNSMPSAGAAGSNTSNTMALANFQKNNISQSGAHRFLDLSSDIRRYSKITNFEQQNASNLLPNYLSRSSQANLNELPQPTSATTSFELFNLPSTSMYDKPFGSINLTTQNHFEPQSSSGKFSNLKFRIKFHLRRTKTMAMFAIAGTGSQRQPANNFNSNNDSYSYSNVRTENTTSNNNQLESWADGQQHLESSTNQSINMASNHLNSSPNDQNDRGSSSHLFDPLTTPQPNNSRSSPFFLTFTQETISISSSAS